MTIGIEQLVLELATPAPQRLANFLPGRNIELVAVLRRFVTDAAGESGMLIWGAAGAGKTHLLHAAVALAQDCGIGTMLAQSAGDLDDAVLGAPPGFVAIDRIDEAQPDAQARVFTLYNVLKERRGRLLVASRTPLATLPLREDLRTRLGWGLVYEALPLADDEKPAALAAYARQHGFDLSAEVSEYLLRHGRRDMPSLLATLASLDRYSLAVKRPITVPLVKDWLQRDLEWKPRATPADRSD